MLNCFLQSQRSYKVVMNSVYGFLGASKGFVPIVPIAASVTATGRKMIEHTAKRAVELIPGSVVVYGDTDSVMVKMNVPDKEDGTIDMEAHFKMAQWLADEITGDFRAPNVLEFEVSQTSGGDIRTILCLANILFTINVVSNQINRVHHSNQTIVYPY